MLCFTLKSELKKNILKVDWDNCVSTASQHSSTALVAKFFSSVSWLKLWYMAHLTMVLVARQPCKALYRTLTKPRFVQSICSTCGIESYFEHYTLCHTQICNPQLIVDSLTREGNEIFDYARHAFPVIIILSFLFSILSHLHHTV